MASTFFPLFVGFFSFTCVIKPLLSRKKQIKCIYCQEYRGFIMKFKPAFSLAEALITLLIVCIIAIVSVPMITKKSKKAMRTEFWQKDSYADSAVSVRNGYDVRFGTATDKKNQSIVVIGTLYFKDRNGKVIGWISEDGTNSFTTKCPSVSSSSAQPAYNVDPATINQLMQMVQNLSVILEQQKNASVSIPSSTVNTTTTRRTRPRRHVPADTQPSGGAYSGYQSQTSMPSSSMNIDPSQMQSALQGMDPGQLQQMMNQVMQMFPMQ